MQDNEKRGRLYVVSTHIGNKEDITLRAIEVLKLSDLIICEELKVGSILLKELRIDKKLETLNEQNEEEKVFEYIRMMQENDKKLALISDCGTPVFADPGYSLVKNTLMSNINVIVVPGVTSLMTALVRSGLPLNQFLYAGFLSRKREERVDELINLSKEPRTIVIYDTPYRLLPLLEDASKIMPHRKVYIGMNLTMPYETHHYGTFSELYNKFSETRIKAEFVICFEGTANAELSKKFAFRKGDILGEESDYDNRKRINNYSNTPYDRAKNYRTNNNYDKGSSSGSDKYDRRRSDNRTNTSSDKSKNYRTNNNYDKSSSSRPNDRYDKRRSDNRTSTSSDKSKNYRSNRSYDKGGSSKPTIFRRRNDK